MWYRWEKRGYLKKCLTQKVKGNRPRGRPRTRWIDLIRKDEKWGAKIGKKYNKTGSGRTETDGDFSVIEDPYLWK